MIGQPVSHTVHVEHRNNGFSKYHLNQDGALPWPFRPVLHHFTKPDFSDPHDHPWDFRTTVLRGSYVAEEYHLSLDKERLVATSWVTLKEGDTMHFSAELIHRIVDLPGGECWTWVEYGPCRRESLFYRFEHDGSYRTRPWHQEQFT